MTKESSVLYTRIPSTLHDRLKEEASLRHMPLAAFVSRLLKESLDNLIPADNLRLTKE